MVVHGNQSYQQIGKTCTYIAQDDSYRDEHSAQSICLYIYTGWSKTQQIEYKGNVFKSNQYKLYSLF